MPLITREVPAEKKSAYLVPDSDTTKHIRLIQSTCDPMGNYVDAKMSALRNAKSECLLKCTKRAKKRIFATNRNFPEIS